MKLSDAISSGRAEHAGLDLAAGQTVLDSVTGFVGTVVQGTAVHRVGGKFGRPATLSDISTDNMQRLVLVQMYTVRLSDGRQENRRLDQLVKLPAGVSDGLELFEA